MPAAAFGIPCRESLQEPDAGISGMEGLKEPASGGVLCMESLQEPAVGISGIISGMEGMQRPSSGGAASSLWPFGSRTADEEEEGEEEDRPGRSAGFENWDENQILQNWHLDPDDFMDAEESSSPEIPEELQQYFEEVTWEAVQWYAGYTPREADLSAYSPRADAIREAVRQAARRLARKEERELLKDLRAAASSIDGQSFQKMLAALQGDGIDGGAFSGDLTASSEDRGEEKLSEDARTPDGDPAARESKTFDIPPLQAYLQERRMGAVSAQDVQETDEQDAEAPDRQEAGEPSKENASSSDSSVKMGSAGNASESEHLPVPPALYDFSIHFPADATKMETPGGWTLFPGLSQYIKTADLPDPAEYRAGAQAYVRELAVPERAARPGREILAVRDPDGAAFAAGSRDEETFAVNDPDEGAFTGGDPAGTMPFSGMGTGVPFAQEPDAEERRTVFIGDSRTVGMQIYVGGEENEYWSARNSMGYNWMVSTGVPAVDDLIGKDTDVVILMGVNDMGNMARYVDYMNEKAAEWKARGARTFFVSVTPVRENRSHNATNARIEEFNAYAKANLRGVYYIDAYSRIRDSFGSPDGLHYDGPTYWEIYEIIHFHLYRGWYETEGLWFWFDCGRPVTGWNYVDGQWQYMDGLGVRWVKNGRVGDVVLAPYPETGILDPYEAVIQKK